MSKINLAAKLEQFSDHWAPRTVSQFNGYDVMVVKSKGEFVWHSHPDTDDFFLVLKVHMLLIEPAGTPNTGDPKTAAERRTI